jgi:putative transposase
VEKGLARKVGMYLCHQYSGAKLRDIGEKFTVGESAVSQGSRRMQDKLAEDKTLRGEIERICRILGIVNV